MSWMGAERILIRCLAPWVSPVMHTSASLTGGVKLCTEVHPSRGTMYLKHILPRSYVLQGRTTMFSPTLHTSMQFTWDFIIKFWPYIFKSISCIHDFPNIKRSITLIVEIKIWIHNSASCKKSYFCNHEAILILFGFCKWEHLSPTYTCCPKTWTSTYNMSCWHLFKSTKQSQLTTWIFRHWAMQDKHIHC